MEQVKNPDSKFASFGVDMLWSRGPKGSVRIAGAIENYRDVSPFSSHGTSFLSLFLLHGGSSLFCAPPQHTGSSSQT